VEYNIVEMNRKMFVLGGNSFVAKVFHEVVKDHENVFALSKEELNFLEPASYSIFDFSNSIIVDFVNVNNGNEQDIMACNYYGFSSFCRFLKGHAFNFRYVYISTISTLCEQHVAASPYVRSKKLAEEFLMKAGIDFQIMRLSYPIGKGESKLRLISRLIQSLKEGQNLEISNYLINLNYVKDVAKHIYQNISRETQIFVSNNQYVLLGDAVLLLKDMLKSASQLLILDVKYQFAPMSDNPYVPSRNIKDVLIDMI
jgi:dTDP-4-dehydrorhamnose reductase